MCNNTEASLCQYWPLWQKCQRAYAIMNCLSFVIVIILCCHHPVSSQSVNSPPGYRFNQKNFIYCTHLHICPLYMHIEYLVHMVYTFKMAAILLFFFICPSCQYGLTWSFHILHKYTSVLGLPTHK